jgi:hypothetical protein
MSNNSFLLLVLRLFFVSFRDEYATSERHPVGCNLRNLAQNKAKDL